MPIKIDNIGIDQGKLLFVPYTGATTNVDLGTKTLGAGAITGTSLILSTTGNIAGKLEHLGFNLDPYGFYTYQDHEFLIIPSLDAAITITNIKATCELDPATELDWNLKYCDAFIGQANPVLISVMNTAAGVFDSGAISVVVPIGKALYLNFDTAPATTPNQVCVDITFKYN